MSPVVAPPPRARRLQIERPPAPAPPRVHAWREPLAVFTLAFAAYAALGLYTTLGLDIVLGDAESRLAHAYYVWWNQPTKLTAIGFYWPPLQTLALLPGAAVRPLATSLAALPLTSAFFGAVLVMFVDRALAFAPLDRRLRWAIAGAFAVNPMIAYFATNGMAETLYLALFAGGLFFFVRWTLTQRWQDLPLMGLAFALGALARYEIAFWIPLVVAGVIAILFARRASPDRIEGSTLAILAPVAYGLLLWVFVNWTITGDPTAFLQVASRPELEPTGSSLELIGKAFATHVALFPVTLLLGLGLVVGGVGRRNVTALVLGASLFVNVVTTIAFLLYTPEAAPLLLRYNMRGIPVALIAAAWLLSRVPRPRRTLAATVTLAVLLLSNAATGLTMLRADDQLGESAFLHGLARLENQDGKPGPKGPGLSMADQEDMAAYVRANVAGQNAVLVDDSQSFGVILHDGHPERYLDRIDVSDRRWLAVRGDPVGRVDYVLVNRNATRAGDPVFYDRILDLYPGLGHGRPPAFLRLVHQNPTYALYRVAG
jgi:hypothetical protein